jgi:CubicO group peptidase (beta-lactamase class C family)
MDTIVPENAGVSASGLDRIREAMQAYVDDGKLAGLITMLARRGQVFHFECLGMMDLEANKPMQADTIFRIYSMTKPITSVAVMMLFEEGHLQLKDPVSRFIPAFQDIRVFVNETDAGLELADLEREVTIQDLLTHTSGLVYGDPEGSPVEVMVWQADRETEKVIPDETLAEWIPRLVRLPLAHQPGSQWHYGLSTDVLGYVVEVISGLAFDAFLDQRILGPLAMVDTGFYVPAEKIDRLAAMYGASEDGGLQLMDAPETSQYARPRRFLSGGGGLVSTAADYLRFAQMLLNGGELDGVRLLGQETVELMTMNHLPEPLMPIELGPLTPYLKGHGFGLGFAVVTDVAHCGLFGSEGAYSWGGAANTFFWVDPKEELIGLIMPQFTPSAHYPLQREFQELAYQVIHGHGT